jgi:hypothetical protein
MTLLVSGSSDIAPALPGEVTQSARTDFIAALLWIVFGLAIAIASWRMDRLQNQDINPYTIPGLLPGLLGVAIMFFGALMLLRSWRAGGLASRAGAAERMTAAALRRFAIIVALCLVFGVALVGRGLPFWIAAALYVSSTIAVLQYPQRRAENQVLRGLIMAIIIGVSAGVVITLVFQELFLVRLP